MATFSNTYNNGRPKYFSNRNIKASNDTLIANEPPENTSNVIDGLYGLDIKTNIQNKSVKIVKNSQIVAHIDLEELVTFDLNSDNITIHTADNHPIILKFVNEAEALLGDERLTNCQNGQIMN